MYCAIQVNIFLGQRKKSTKRLSPRFFISILPYRWRPNTKLETSTFFVVRLTTPGGRLFYFFLYFTLMSSSSSGTRLTGRRRVTIFQQFCLPCASRGFTTTGIGMFYFRVYLSHIDFFCLGCVKRIPPVQTATKSHLAFLVVGLTTSGGRMSISSSEVLLC